MALSKILSSAFLLAFALPFFWAGVDRRQPGAQSASSRSVQSCRACHQPIFETYIQTAHFKTSSPATEESIKGDFSAGRNVFGARFKMEKRADGFYQTAYESSAARSRTERFDIVIGSGRKGQSYLYWKDGLLFQLPVSYLAGAGGWANSPGFVDGEAHFDRLIPPRCLECHSASFKPAGAPSAPRYSSDYELGISCQNCHGDGSNHAAYHISHPAEKTGRQILNPARFSRDRKLDNCALCHSGAAREMKRPPFSYQPGDKLEAYLLPESDRDHPVPDVHGNQVALLRRSKCYRASETMSCSTCHNVHQLERDLTWMARKCLQCHQTNNCKMAGRVGARLMSACIDCHMPNQSSRLIVIDTSAGKLPIDYRNHTIDVYPKVAETMLQAMREK